MTKSVKRVEPQKGQESVWDYPRPPRLESSSRRVRVVFGGVTVAETRRAYRVLETSHPPTWYLPFEDILPGTLVAEEQTSFCEFKGRAVYWQLQAGGEVSRHAAWSYPKPGPAFAAIRDYVAFYPSRMEACFVDEERVESQPGDFYGGWITSDVVGPFKGSPGTWGW